MTKENLLIPRWKVIEDFPFKSFPDMHKVGDIITDDGKSPAIDQNGNPVFICEWNKYPYIFKPLPWWAERSSADMPNYVKLNPENTIGGDRVFKVLYKHVCDDGIELVIDDEKQTNMECKYLIPCDESDYISYIKSLEP